jgi:hypothetical protein
MISRGKPKDLGGQVTFEITRYRTRVPEMKASVQLPISENKLINFVAGIDFLDCHKTFQFLRIILIVTSSS